MAQSENPARFLKSLAKDHGFFLQGICPAVQPPYYHQVCDWLDGGYAGTMDYLPQRKEAYSHPRHILDGAQSVMMLAMNYHPAGSHIPKKITQSLKAVGPKPPKTAKYIHSGADYHDVVHKKLKRMVREVRERFPEFQARGVVDTAPLLERDFARLSGLGWIGKNTMLINKRHGSFFFLAALILNVPLPYDPPHQEEHCGTCTRCLDSCPTNAFLAPYQMDATRCISYWTIESKELAPPELRIHFDDWFFGCDVCQDVCPWNRHTRRTEVEQLQVDPGFEQLELTQFFQMNEEEFRAKFRKTPLWRSRLEGMMRNAAIVWANQRDHSKIPWLKSGLENSAETVADACRWAIQQIKAS